MFKIKILKNLIVIATVSGLLFTFSFLTACKETIPIKEVLEETDKEETLEEIEEITEEEVEEPEQVITDQTLGSCYNSYFPIKENMVWNYNLKATGIESFDYSLSFKDITDNASLFAKIKDWL